jgi:hypothetical protein
VQCRDGFLRAPLDRIGVGHGPDQLAVERDAHHGLALLQTFEGVFGGRGIDVVLPRECGFPIRASVPSIVARTPCPGTFSESDLSFRNCRSRLGRAFETESRVFGAIDVSFTSRV